MSTRRPTKAEMVKQFASTRAGYSPAKGDVIRWSEVRNGRRQTYQGKVQTTHADRWLVMVGPGRLHSLTRPAWDATGVVVEAAAHRRLVLAV